MSSRKIRKEKIVRHIKNTKPLERFQIDLIQLARIVSSKDYKYLFRIFDHFSKWHGQDELKIKNQS